MKLEKDLIPVKLINFVFQAGMACFVPYKALFQKQLGLSPAQNGIIQSIEKALTLVAPPVIGGIADKFSRHKFTLNACILASVAFTLPMYFVPSIKESSQALACCFQKPHLCYTTEQNFSLNCNYKNLSQDISNCSNSMNQDDMYTCKFTPGNSSQETATMNCTDNSTMFCEQKEVKSLLDIYGKTFGIMLGLTIFYAAAFSPIQPLIDATVMNMLGDGRMHKYGNQRLWGSIGFGIVAFAMGFLADVITPSTEQNDKNYLACFIGAAVFGILATFVSHWLKVPALKKPSMLKGAKQLLTNAQILLFLLVILTSGMLLGVKYAFVFWYAESLPGSSQSILGLSILLGSATEIPAFFVSGKVSNVIGDDLILYFGLLVASLRCFLYTVLTSAWQLLLVESLHGLSFAFPMAAMCSKSAALAPAGMTATLIGLTQGVYWGLGNMLGALFGGFIFESLGAVMMFRIFAAIGGFVSVMFTTIYVIRSLCSGSKPDEEKKVETNIDEAIPLAKTQANV
uniref:Major facilitator superfamily domain-containing protein 6-like n=1 Tax=Phallusia mammillata TaxID=59560 RepID=A0A6F9DKY5_9ASCI|nr:major facilitator superfamily domain-containing protein 6-like [Phallusia mammillata]